MQLSWNCATEESSVTWTNITTMSVLASESLLGCGIVSTSMLHCSVLLSILFRYQKTGVRWLLKLHEQYVGGILAGKITSVFFCDGVSCLDEMGLGKTIQIAIFLRCIAESEQMSRIFDYTGLGPVLVIAPTTLMGQWVTELNKWFPRCRTAIFHSSGSFDGSRSSLLRKMSVPRSSGSVLITSYTTFTMFKSDFKKINWHYVILDEGHKIRNPDAKTTIALKEIRTPHRLLLSGSPLQNNLRELWSLVSSLSCV